MRGWRDWDLSLGPVSGQPGDVKVITEQLQVAFRGQKVMATDTGSPPGTGTRIAQLLVGQRIQRPTANGSTLVEFFGPTSLGNGVTWDTCQPGQTISVTVSFVQACEFSMSVFGRAII